MNGGEKCRKWGGLGRLGVTQGHGQCHHSIERIPLANIFFLNGWLTHQNGWLTDLIG